MEANIVYLLGWSEMSNFLNIFQLKWHRFPIWSGDNSSGFISHVDSRGVRVGRLCFISRTFIILIERPDCHYTFVIECMLGMSVGLYLWLQN